MEGGAAGAWRVITHIDPAPASPTVVLVSDHALDSLFIGELSVALAQRLGGMRIEGEAAAGEALGALISAFRHSPYVRLNRQPMSFLPATHQC